MIRLTRLNGYELFLNADLIATVESHPDTVVMLVDGTRYVVTEPAEAIVDAITTYRASVIALAEAMDREQATDREPGHLYVLRPGREG